ncbi:unnamed protein product [Penicillium nalgiovense]|uniref:Trichothecene 3-O-acetyltransferase-like N-terminal domain-containing protein n=2 Tax=Penicillium nalgiovense TaxID=60175 RepID=A0A9W4HXX4_PENNA|nr:unnamed protein product [Penicillium nalgiovense]CAG7949028.1 unnamed protein product [Penicillium nalgiovense]CAG7950330.1 unnamed protein product [Penicillium nalgiovense]CAG7962280.1 unnamed protein product [Penicillium nalgiovense]CAG7987691.1 unnamed protein product [Penicillium nalgiovense]
MRRFPRSTSSIYIRSIQSSAIQRSPLSQRTQPTRDSNPANMFQPYNLTPLDQFSPPGHFAMSLTFNLIDKNRAQVLQRMEDAVSCVLSKFPFLSGMVVPSTQRDGKSNALQVRPSTAAELEEGPMVVTQHHTEPTALTVDGKFNTALMPFPVVSPPRSPSPVLRLKAHVIEDNVHLVLCFDHRVMDGSGIFVLLYTFAAFCHDLNATGPFTTSQAQEETRQHIEQVASTATPRDLQWTSLPTPTSEDEAFIGYGRVPIGSSHVFDGQKINMLLEACNSALQSLPETYRKDIPEISLRPGLLVSAMLGICSNRARLRAFPDEPQLSSDMFIVENLRKALKLHRGYLGSTIGATQTKCDGSAHPPPDVLQNIHVPEPLSPVGAEDIWRVCNVAQSLQEASGRLDKLYTEGMIAKMSCEQDWSSFRPGWGVNFLVSDIKSAKPYGNFGPLGDLELFDLHFDTQPGYCWIMPNLPSDPALSYSCWRLRWVLERAAMECLSSDPLFRWASTPVTASTHAEV